MIENKVFSEGPYRSCTSKKYVNFEDFTYPDHNTFGHIWFLATSGMELDNLKGLSA